MVDVDTYLLSLLSRELQCYQQFYDQTLP
jgi:hypothetical protein